MNEVIVGIVGIFVLLALFCTGIEIGFAMALIGFLGFSYLVSVPAALNLLAKDFFEVFSFYNSETCGRYQPPRKGPALSVVLRLGNMAISGLRLTFLFFIDEPHFTALEIDLPACCEENRAIS